MALTVDVDKDVCISSGRCVAEEPSSFRFDEDELAEAVQAQPELSDERLIEITRNCPSGAITLRDGDEPIDVG